MFVGRRGSRARWNEPEGTGSTPPVASVSGREDWAMQQRLLFFLVAGAVLLILNALGVVAGVVVFPLF